MGREPAITVYNYKIIIYYNFNYKNNILKKQNKLFKNIYDSQKYF